MPFLIPEIQQNYSGIQNVVIINKAIHYENLKLQPEYLYDICKSYFFNLDTKEKYGYSYITTGHPNGAGYLALADYFADKIGLI